MAPDSKANGLVPESYTENRSTITNECLNYMNVDTVENKQKEEKLSKLEEVVEKVVEMYVEHPMESNLATAGVTSNDKAQSQPQQEKKESTREKREDETEANIEEEKDSEDIASPSQSQSSRATRWEALADIAAELPPSLAVDPITGQIYSLSK